MAINRHGTIGWFSPDPRAIIPLDDRFHIPHGLKRTLRKGGFDIAAEHKNIAGWLERIKALPGWKHPYDLMPGHPLPGR